MECQQGYLSEKAKLQPFLKMPILSYLTLSLQLRDSVLIFKSPINIRLSGINYTMIKIQMIEPKDWWKKIFIKSLEECIKSRMLLHILGHKKSILLVRIWNILIGQHIKRRKNWNNKKNSLMTKFTDEEVL